MSHRLCAAWSSGSSSGGAPTCVAPRTDLWTGALRPARSPVPARSPTQAWHRQSAARRSRRSSAARSLRAGALELQVATRALSAPALGLQQLLERPPEWRIPHHLLGVPLGFVELVASANLLQRSARRPQDGATAPLAHLACPSDQPRRDRRVVGRFGRRISASVLAAGRLGGRDRGPAGVGRNEPSAGKPEQAPVASFWR